MKLIQQLSDHLLAQGLISSFDVEWLTAHGYLPQETDYSYHDYYSFDLPEPIPESQLEAIEEELIQDALRKKSELPSRASKGSQRKKKRLQELRQKSEQEREARRKTEAEDQIAAAQQLPPASALLALRGCLLSHEPWLKLAASRVLSTIASTSHAKFIAVLECLSASDELPSPTLASIMRPAFDHLRTKSSAPLFDLAPLLKLNPLAFNGILTSLSVAVLDAVEFKVLLTHFFNSLSQGNPIDRKLLCKLFITSDQEIHQETLTLLKSFPKISRELATDLKDALLDFDPTVQGYVLAYLLQREAIHSLSLPEVKLLKTNGPSHLYLTSISELSAEAIRLLVRGAYYLNLSGLKELTLEMAQELKAASGYLHLDGVEQLTPDVANALAERSHFLSLVGIKSLTTDVAEGLGRHNGELMLNGLTHISPDVAKALAAHQGVLKLNGLKELSQEAAKHLRAVKSPLFLNGLEVLTEEVAEELSQHLHPLWLCGLKSLTLNAATKLELYGGELRLNGLGKISNEVAESLGKHVGNLHLDRLVPDGEIVEKICHCQGDLWLGGLSSLTDSMAISLSQHHGTLGLQGLKQMTVQHVRILNQHKGTIKLGSLRDMSAEVRDLLTKNEMYHFLNTRL